MSTENNAYNYTGDRPITEEKDDKLGFSTLADQIALSLTQAKIENGFVVGIEGEWGSGKSSLINLIKNKIEKEQNIIIVDFKPWLVGNRDILINALFYEFVTALKEYFPYNEIEKNFKSFIKAAEDGFPKIKLFKFLTNWTTFFLKKMNSIFHISCIDIFIEFLYRITLEDSISNVKNQLTTIFQDIDRRIIVVIDDLDRLDPSEAVEVLRLVRSVADFPNVTYVLSYDRDILCKAVEEQIKIDSGQSYLEKIIQLTIPLFLPNFSDLLSWFKDELSSLAPGLPSYQKTLIHISSANEGWHRIKTPRVLIKILDSIRFYLPYVKKYNLNLGDFIWLQIIKNDNPDLYNWIENYCKNVFYYSLFGGGGFPDKKTKELEELNIILDKVSGKQKYNILFSHYLPSVNTDDQYNLDIYVDGCNPLKNYHSIKFRRLRSINHFYLYFYPRKKSFIFSPEEENKIFNRLEESLEEAESVLMDLCSAVFTDSLNKASLLLQWILEGVYDVNPMIVHNIIMAMSNIMDNVIKKHKDINIFNSFLCNFFKENINKNSNYVSRFFKNGAAIGWISLVFRSEFWAHGQGGGHKQSESEWLLDEEKLDKIISIMKERYLHLSKEQIFQNVRGWVILEAWKSVDNTEFKKFWDSNTKEDLDFIKMIEYLFDEAGYSKTHELYKLLKMPDLDGNEDNPTFYKTTLRIESLKNDHDLGDRAIYLSKKIGKVSYKKS